ncbi:hypothetical protein GCM10009560_79040 [Nonomuraea longicatena]|uniref:Uncharacterized protein n=1 Tax=Nonomuraea longicatena TaxID=83682 RepID=A0ABN1RCX0_9ACTN
MARMQLTRLDDDKCDEGTCPAIYRTDRGTIAIQGARVLDDHGLNIPDHETVVEIPEEMFWKVARDHS